MRQATRVAIILAGAAAIESVLAVLAIALAAGLLLGQSPVTTVAVNGGTATDERGVRSGVMTIAPSLSFQPSANTSVVLGANGTRFANSTWQAGGSIATAGRAALGAGFAMSIAAGGSATQASFNATFAQADATPALQWGTGPLTLIGGLHAAAGYTAVSSTTAPTSPLTTASTQLVSASRTAVAPSYGAELRLGIGSPVVTLLTFRAEPTAVEGVRVNDNIGSAAFSFGGVLLTAVGGHRSAPDENVSFASGSASVPITSMLALTIGGGSYPSNRLTGAAGGHFFSSGISLRFGGQLPHEPEPSGVRPVATGLTRLALKAPDANSVEIAGDWNNWTRSPAKRAANGVWYADVPLAPGEYRYAFLVEGHDWRVPDGALTVDDGFGSKAAYVTVRSPDTVQVKHGGAINQEER